MANIIHMVGTGTIGEPLIRLFTDFREKLGIDEVTFHKRTPFPADKARLNHLMQRGAKLATEYDRKADFEEMGHEVSYSDRGSPGAGHRGHRLYPGRQQDQGQVLQRLTGPKGFLAQGSDEASASPTPAASTTRPWWPARGSLHPGGELQHSQYFDFD